MRISFVIILAIIISLVFISGCVWDSPTVKVPPSVDNRTLAIVNFEWIRPDNVSIINSTVRVTYLYFDESTNVTSEYIQFNGTDGKTHTCNLTRNTKYDTIGVLDIDGGNVTRY